MKQLIFTLIILIFSISFVQAEEADTTKITKTFQLGEFVVLVITSAKSYRCVG